MLTDEHFTVTDETVAWCLCRICCSGTDLHFFLWHWEVSGVLQELSHIGHDGLLIRVSNVHICIHITILHDKPDTTTPLSMVYTNTWASFWNRWSLKVESEEWRCNFSAFKTPIWYKPANKLTSRAERNKWGFIWDWSKQAVRESSDCSSPHMSSGAWVWLTHSSQLHCAQFHKDLHKTTSNRVFERVVCTRPESTQGQAAE